jgi:tetratricopeptide (TPR) repeat protein
LGETLSKLGDYEQAAIPFRESLRLLQPTSDSRFKGYGIFSLAKILHQQGDSQNAACLLGAVEPETQTDLWKLHRERMDDYFKSVEAIKAALGEETYLAAYEAGRQMSLDEAVNFALKTGEDIAD